MKYSNGVIIIIFLLCCVITCGSNSDRGIVDICGEKGVLQQEKLSANKVYYYERVKIVKDGKQTPSSGDGHYLAINNQILYECNESGSSMLKGRVHYINSNNDRPYYNGNAYLGNDLRYVFNSDFSRLNLFFNDGTIYVYTRKESPSSNSALRVYESHNVNNNVIIGSSYSPTIYDSNSEKKTEYKEKKTMKCPYCNGTGRRLITTPGYLSKNQYWVTCKECGVRHLNTTGHRHVDCAYCNGTGKYRL